MDLRQIVNKVITKTIGRKEHSYYKCRDLVLNGDTVRFERCGQTEGFTLKKRQRGHYFLEIEKENGNQILFFDKDNLFGRSNLRVDFVRIFPKGSEEQKEYGKNEVGTPVVKKAQKKFNEYLKKIAEHKRKEGLDYLK